MAGSLSLSLYSLARRRGAVVGEGAVPRPARPAGRLAWLHVPSQSSAPTMLELARRLVDEDGISVLVTSALSLPLEEGVIYQSPPIEMTGVAEEFLDHWRPEIGVFSEGELRPMLLGVAAARGLPMIMVDGLRPSLPDGVSRWYPGLKRSALAAFSHVTALDVHAAKAFRRAGAGRLEVAGRMEERSTALPCLEAEREDLAELLSARPVWFAVSIPEAEEAAVLAAHRHVISMNHRLLLILMPKDPARAAPLAAKLEEEGWSVASRSAEEEPAPDTEIFVVEGKSELGLWYRLAPVAFLGGSLSGEGAIRSPLEAAALGSAMLHGPRPGRHGGALGRLGAARAARAVASANDLCEALDDLLSPDRAARLAQAAWNVATEGAEVTEAVIARIRRLMDGEPEPVPREQRGEG